MNRYRESKEEIKDRMIKTALDYWNIKKVENLDPFVRLLIEALAMQLHLLSDDIADIELRTMRRLSEVLLPESVMMARPAHAVAYIKPLIDNVVTNPLHGFYTISPFVGEKTTTRYSFFPVCKTQLFRGSIQKMVVGGDIYEVQNGLDKKLIFRQNTSPENCNKVFVGIEVIGEQQNLKHLSLYLDFPNVDRRRESLRLLSFCEWKHDGKPIKVSNRLHVIPEKEDDALSDFFRSQENSVQLNESVLQFYQSHYVTIEDDLLIDETSCHSWPEGMDEVELTRNPKSLLWLEIDFPPQFSFTVLSDIQIVVNAIPLVNRDLRSVNHTAKNDIGVIPIPVKENEALLNILDVTDSMNRIYGCTYGYKKQTSDCCYTLRQGGCETFDYRDAKDYLLRLQHLLEDEMSLFSSSEMGNNTENVYLIERLLSKISQVSKRSLVGSDSPYYLFVEPPEGTNFFYVRYWTTLGELANGIRIGQSLNPQESMFGDVEPAVLVTPTLGGMPPPSGNERIARFKYILGSRNRVVTNNDIRNFCLAELSDVISDVYVEKGIVKSETPGEGLLRTIDVHLVPIYQMEDQKQRKQIVDTLYDHLMEHSPMTFNYRIIID
ncbi:MAG: hypothetical protein M0P12_03835 [Paludibacteraceae bacterium]|nr:hypothetical protein [Paludibacteraceae bacterium]